MRVAFKTFGCRLNRADTDRFASDFAAAGWQVVPFGAAAEAVVIHSCAVTRTAERDGLRAARAIKRDARLAGRPEPFVVLSGCVVEADLSRRSVVGADLLAPRGMREHLPGWVASGLAAARPAGVAPQPASAAVSVPRRKRALLKVQDGCDFGCAYCIVPRTRGAPVSRPLEACLSEAASLIAAGFGELVLTGCNLGCYRDGRRRLPELVDALTRLDGIARIRLGSIEPLTVEREIADRMASCSKLCRQLHLPLQSGDADILRSMGRRYTPDDYRSTLAHILSRVPDVGLGCDVIAGLPGETAAAFERTRQLIDEWPFSNLHVFTYSERPGTRAADLPGRVPLEERQFRARALIAMLAPKRQAFAASFVGRPVEALIETAAASRGCGEGWSGAYLRCRVRGVTRADVGRLVGFTPDAADGGVLSGGI